MGEERAVELRHEGKTYRAAGRDVFFKWAREHRISTDDSYRVAGTDKWIPVTANSELNALLDPENWWKVRMGGKTYVAPDWETIVKWAQDGRLSTDVQIEGPKTPPGGILGKASPELSPHLREWSHDDPERQPVRIRFDGRTFIPGDVKTLQQWIRESRVPMEAQVMTDGEEWEPITECADFSKDLWPDAESITDAGPGERPPSDRGHSAPPEKAGPERTVRTGEGTDENPETRAEAREGDRLYRISTSYGEDYVFEDPSEIRDLLKKKRIHGFDEIKHPALPGGVMFVSEFAREFLPRSSTSILLGVLAAVFGAAGAAAIVFQRQGAQWMLIGGIASLVIALILIVRIIWKR
jgi:hypothetical protein